MWTALLPVMAGIIGKVVTNKAEAEQAKLRLLGMDLEQEYNEMRAKGQIISSEAQSESWLARNWRPISMLIFLGMIVSYWFGYSPANMSPDVLDHLFTLVQIGLGGYIVGRSGEKMVKVYSGMKENQSRLEHVGETYRQKSEAYDKFIGKR